MLSSWAVETLIRPTRISQHNTYGINTVILFFLPTALQRSSTYHTAAAFLHCRLEKTKEPFLGIQ